MAQYYSTRRARTFSTSLSPYFSPSSTEEPVSEDWECSFCIFPNPSSLPPTPSSQLSDSSAVAASEADSLAENVISANSTISRKRPRETSLSAEPQHVDGLWVWPKESAFASNSSHSWPHLRSRAEKKPLEPAGAAPHQGDTYAPERQIDFRAPSEDCAPSYLPRKHIPLLSLFASLLSVDAPTLDLLVGPPLTKSTTPGDLAEQEEIANVGNIKHGMEKFYLANSDETFIFRRVMAPSSVDACPDTPPVRPADLLEIVTSLGRRLFR